MAQGKAEAFEHFNPENVGRVQLQASNIVMFTKGLEEFTIKCMVGLKQDQAIKLPSLDLYDYHDIYFPEQNYYNCDLMPIEFLELFAPESEIKDFLEMKDTKKVYIPACSTREMNFTNRSRTFYDKAVIGNQHKTYS